MEGLTFKNNYYTDNVSATGVQQRTENGENFTALDKEQLKQDVVELSNKATESTKDSWITRVLKGFGVKDPKKLLKTLALTVATVAGFAFVGNKLAKPTAKAGIEIDKFLLEGDNFISKGYRAIAQKFGAFKASAANRLKNSKSSTIKDLYETLTKRKATPKNTLAQSYGSGGKGIFGLTSPDTLKTALNERHGTNKVINDIAGNITNKKGLAEFRQEGPIGNILALLKSKKSIAADLNKVFLQEGDDAAVAAMKSLGLSEEKIAENLKQLQKSKEGILNSLDKLWQGEAKEKIYNEMFVTEGYVPMEMSRAMEKGIKEKFNLDTDQKWYDFLNENFPINPSKAQDKYKEFINVDMNKGGISGAWWPVNAINSLGKKIFGEKWKGFARGNLGDAMMKFSMMDGKMAKTLPGKFVQKSVIFPAEYISNFVNDKSGLGVFLCANLVTLYNNVQDAPKEQVKATVADEFVGTIGGVAVTTPIASAIAYGLASLKNLEGKGLIAKALKGLGKVTGLGLDGVALNGEKIASNSALKGTLGGFIRFALIMFVLSPKISKPITAAIHKVFGKPYNKDEEEAKKQQEEAKNTIVPELGITQGELAEKMEKNPEALQRLQKDDELAAKITQNPKLLLDLLDGKEIKDEPIQTVQNDPNAKSPLLEQRINNQTTVQNPNQNVNPALNQNNSDNLDNSADLFSSKTKNKTPNEDVKDTATYVPSSQFVAKEQALSEEKSKEYNEAMAKADKALERAQKYI